MPRNFSLKYNYKKKRNCISELCLTTTLKELNFSGEFLTKADCLTMKALCKRIGVKNSAKNRSNICLLWRKIINKTKGIFENAIEVDEFHLNFPKSVQIISEIDDLPKKEIVIVVPHQNDLCDLDFNIDTDDFLNATILNEYLSFENISKTQKSNSTLEWVYDQKLFLSNEEKLDTKENIRLAITNALIKIKNSCLISYDTIRLRNKFQKKIVVYGRCKYSTHFQRFKFIIDSQYKMDIYITGEKCNVHEGKKLFDQVRGKRRDMLKEKLQHNSAHNVELDMRANVDLDLVKSGNTMKLTTIEVLRKIRSEILKLDDLVLDCDIYDMTRRWDMERLEKDNKYIYCVSLPLVVTLLRRSQLELISKYNSLVIYLDATGSVVKKPKCHPEHYCSTILYYACVIKIGTTIIPVAEMISCKHDIRTISHFLLDFKGEMAEIPKLNFPLIYVVDWTWAYIQAILFIFNNMTVFDYINYTFNILYNAKEPAKDTVSVFICCTHFINIISRQIKKKIPNGISIKNFLLDLFCLILNCDTLNQVQDLFKVYIIICTNKYKTEDVVQAYSQFIELMRFIYSHDTLLDTPTKTDKFDHKADKVNHKKFKNYKTHYSKSLFYQEFFRLYENIQRTIQNEPTGLTENIFYCPDFVLFTIQRYFAYIPLWSTCFSKYLNIEGRMSNSNAELWFSHVKNIYLEKKKYLRIGRFVSLLKHKTELLVSSIAVSDALKATPKSNKKVFLQNSDSDDDPENPKNSENWNKKVRLRKSPKHIGKRVLQRYSTKIVFNKSEDDKASIELPSNKLLLSNGFSYKNENNVEQNIFSTCGFDSMSQIVCTIFRDYEHLNIKLTENDTEYFRFIKHFLRCGADRSTHIMRTQLILKCFNVLNTPGNIQLSCVCNISKYIEYFLSRSIQIDYKCPQCLMSHTKDNYYVPIDYYNFKEQNFKNLQNSFKFYAPNCSNCKSQIEYPEELQLQTNNGFAIVDVQPLNSTTIYTTKISEIQPTLIFGSTTLILVGIVHYRQAQTRGGVGHYIGYIKRKTGVWEIHDDLSESIMETNPENRINPVSLFYIHQIH